MLNTVVQLGNQVAPLPTSLLSAKHPAKAFIGHVEPTFNWTLRQPQSGEIIADRIRLALYNRLFNREPAGMALSECFEPLASLYGQHRSATQAFNMGQNPHDTLLYCSLAATDIQCTVLLGDPTVLLGRPPASP
jgi:hypothetical protein